jgi:hypothetical protein
MGALLVGAGGGILMDAIRLAERPRFRQQVESAVLVGL